MIVRLEESILTNEKNLNLKIDHNLNSHQDNFKKITEKVKL